MRMPSRATTRRKTSANAADILTTLCALTVSGSISYVRGTTSTARSSKRNRDVNTQTFNNNKTMYTSERRKEIVEKALIKIIKENGCKVLNRVRDEQTGLMRTIWEAR